MPIYFLLYPQVKFRTIKTSARLRQVSFYIIGNCVLLYKTLRGMRELNWTCPRCSSLYYLSLFGKDVIINEIIVVEYSKGELTWKNGYM